MKVQAKWNFSFNGHAYKGGEVFEAESVQGFTSDVNVIDGSHEERVANRVTKVVKDVKKK